MKSTALCASIILAATLSASLVHAADEPLRIEIDAKGYLVGAKRLTTLAEVRAELERLQPREVRLIPTTKVTYEKVSEVLAIVQKIGASIGMVGYAAPE